MITVTVVDRFSRMRKKSHLLRLLKKVQVPGGAQRAE